MKTTIEISNAILKVARTTAAREGTTLRALVEEGLRLVIEERKTKARFQLRKVTFRGRGIRDDIREGGWEMVRDLAYEGHGA